MRETEGAHRSAVVELEQMRQNMIKMEEERAAMMAEVEAQIERALQSMMVSESEPEDQDRLLSFTSPRHSRPSSRRSSITSANGSRPPRSFGANAPLTEDTEGEEAAAEEGKKSTANRNGNNAETDKDKSNTEKDSDKDKEQKGEVEPKKLKRFSATREHPGDSIYAVDENISERSDRISRKVLEIQQKVCRRFCFIFQSI